MNTAPIKLYAPDSYKEKRLFAHTELMFPFWGVTVKDTAPFMLAAARQYRYSTEAFTLADTIADCDYVMMPYSYTRLRAVNPELVQRIVDDAQAAGKPLLIEDAGDIEVPIDIPNAVVLRTSEYSYARKSNEITIPFGAEDLLEAHLGNELPLRTKQERPSVGFTGWAELSFKQRVKIALKEAPVTLAALFDEKRGAEHKGVLFRARALAALSSNPRVEPHLVPRATYSGNTGTMVSAADRMRKDFIDNLLGSDYALCVRGDANGSIRFYEALAVGRIPLFVDTACVLPLEDVIDYRAFCVFVDWRDIDRIGDILADFHAALTPGRFEQMQRDARRAYVEHLRTDAFSKELARLLRARLDDAHA